MKLTPYESALSREWSMQRAIEIFKGKDGIVNPEESFPKILDAAKQINQFYENRTEVNLININKAIKP